MQITFKICTAPLRRRSSIETPVGTLDPDVATTQR